MFATYLCCVGSGLCDELITRSEKSYRVCVCLILCDLETSTRQPRPKVGCCATEKEKYMVVCCSDPVFQFSIEQG